MKTILTIVVVLVAVIVGLIFFNREPSGPAASEVSLPESEVQVSQKVFDLAIVERKLTPDIVTVTEGEELLVNVVTDEAGEFHVSGYEIEKDMEIGETAQVRFTAVLPGRYNLELHPGDDDGADHDNEHSEEEDIVIGALVVNPR